MLSYLQGLHIKGAEKKADQALLGAIRHRQAIRRVVRDRPAKILVTETYVEITQPQMARVLSACAPLLKPVSERTVKADGKAIRQLLVRTGIELIDIQPGDISTVVGPKGELQKRRGPNKYGIEIPLDHILQNYRDFRSQELPEFGAMDKAVRAVTGAENLDQLREERIKSREPTRDVDKLIASGLQRLETRLGRRFREALVDKGPQARELEAIWRHITSAQNGWAALTERRKLFPAITTKTPTNH